MAAAGIGNERLHLCRRVAFQGRHRSGVRDGSVEKDHDLIGKAAELTHVVGDPHDRGPSCREVAGKSLQDRARPRVDRRRRLIHQEHLGLGGQSARETHALRFPAREILCRTTDEDGVEVDPFEQHLRGAPADLRVGDAEVLQHGSAERCRSLEHHPHSAPQRQRTQTVELGPAKRDPSCGWSFEAIAQPQEGRLARARRPDNHGDADTGDLDVYVTQETAVGAVDADVIEDVEDFVDGAEHRAELTVPLVVAPLLDGRIALITGAASGQGRAASVLFAEHGARVVIADIDQDGAGETVEMVRGAGSEALAVACDISRRSDCDAMVAAAVDRFGGIDILYNNAAVQMSGRLTETSEADWDLTIATNLDAVFWACRAAIPIMAEGGRGSIISTASTLGLIGSEGYAAYGAAKAGLVALTRQIATEYGPEVRANVIAPGSIDTPRFQKVTAERDDPDGFLEGLTRIIPMHRLGTAEDVAGIALFLASNLSAYTSGAVIPADGGLAAYR